MAVTDALARSFFDLWHHLDPVGASRFDPIEARPDVAGFDLEGVRQHLAALRALAGAAEELEISSLEDEVDRTILLDAIRGLERRFADGGPYRNDPAFGLDRLIRAARDRPDDPAVPAQIPAIVETARATLTRPSPARLALALELVPLAEELVAADRRAVTALRELDQFLREDLAPTADPGGDSLGSEAAEWVLHYGFGLEAAPAAALRQLAREAERLEHELEAAASGVVPGRAWRSLVATSASAPADLGAFEDAIDREVEAARLLDVPIPPGTITVTAMSAADALVTPIARADLGSSGALESERVRLSVDPAQAADPGAFAARYGPLGESLGLIARSGALSEIRRRYVAPGWLDGFGLFALARRFRSSEDHGHATIALGAEALFAVLLAAVDLSIQTGQMTPAEAETRLAARYPAPGSRIKAAVRSTLLAPLDAAGAALVAAAWDHFAVRRGERPDRLAVRIAQAGVLHPATAEWRLDATGS
jgi:hypothetical protein